MLYGWVTPLNGSPLREPVITASDNTGKNISETGVSRHHGGRIEGPLKPLVCKLSQYTIVSRTYYTHDGKEMFFSRTAVRQITGLFFQVFPCLFLSDKRSGWSFLDHTKGTFYRDLFSCLFFCLFLGGNRLWSKVLIEPRMKESNRLWPFSLPFSVRLPFMKQSIHWTEHR